LVAGGAGGGSGRRGGGRRGDFGSGCFGHLYKLKMESECDGGFDKEVKQAGAAAIMGYAPQEKN
jgi:hypothetical protein